MDGLLFALNLKTNVVKKIITLSLLYLFKIQFASSQTVFDSTEESKWTDHFQLTVISQSHLAFKALYSGTNSLSNVAQFGATSITSTLFLGRKLWNGGVFYFDPEISGGQGLSFAQGVAGALNGETYRVGNPTPGIFIARGYLQQQIPLGNTEYETVEDDVNQIKDKIPMSRITISAGKFAISDFYDANKYSNDPRTQFINWSVMANGAWDYPANTRGYTMGAVVELIKPKWAVRVSSVAVPKIANAPEMEYDIERAHSETAEMERKISINKRPGTVRFFASNTHSRAPSYAEGMKALETDDTSLLDVFSGKTESETFGGKKFGLGLSGEQELNDDIGFFMRAGWNDGQYATWAFTEIDQTLSTGISIRGTKWKRKDDVVGIAGVVNGISAAHKDFLAAGGYGFIIGDGKLNYEDEAILETYYNAHFSKFFWLTFDYQFVNNPAYNKDRGPVNVFAVRGHVEF